MEVYEDIRSLYIDTALLILIARFSTSQKSGHVMVV
jgi:hypothetical protein